MDLHGKDVWDLTLDEIEYVYQHRHMNNYVYAGVETYHRSRMPLDRVVRLRRSRSPDCLHDGAGELLRLSPYLGREDPRTVRINYTYHAFGLLAALDQIELEQMDQTIDLLCALAYIPIVAEKNDGLAIWLNPAVRRMDPETEQVFESIGPEIDLQAFIEQPLWKNDTGIVDDEIHNVPSLLLYYFIPRAVQSILVMVENGVDHERAAVAFRDVEHNMLRYEQRADIGNKPEYRRRGGTRYPSNQRYRNTLFLYGGNILERMGRLEEAFDWYTRDIYITNLPDIFGFYLTALKTCERLLCGLRVAPDGTDTRLLRDLVERSVHAAFRAATPHANKVRQYVAEHPEADLAAIRFFTNKEKTRDILCAGEAARECFLLSLLYNRIINDVPYADVDYARVLRY